MVRECNSFTTKRRNGNHHHNQGKQGQPTPPPREARQPKNGKEHYHQSQRRQQCIKCKFDTQFRKHLQKKKLRRQEAKSAWEENKLDISNPKIQRSMESRIYGWLCIMLPSGSVVPAWRLRLPFLPLVVCVALASLGCGVRCLCSPSEVVVRVAMREQRAAGAGLALATAKHTTT